MKKKLLGLILLGISSLTLTGCEKVEAYKIDMEEAIKEKQEEAEELPLLNMEEEFILDYFDSGKYGLTFDGVRKTDKRNEFAPYEAKEVVLVDFVFENYSVNKDIMVTEGVDFKVFDQNKKQLKTYPVVEPSKCPFPGGPGTRSSASIALGSEDELKELNIVVYNQEKPIGYINVQLEPKKES